MAETGVDPTEIKTYTDAELLTIFRGVLANSVTERYTYEGSDITNWPPHRIAEMIEWLEKRIAGTNVDRIVLAEGLRVRRIARPNRLP